jgi:RsiW-degrading membrane proteinase PrsW (M82 family)
MALTALDMVIVLLVAFIPAFLYVIWIRNAEVHLREPLTAVAWAFLFGATVSIFIAFIIELIAVVPLTFILAEATLITLVLAIVVAPIVEEFTKATGVLFVRRRLTEPENGFIYGAAVGLGFAATENTLYFLSAYLEGMDIFITLAIARTLTSTLLHASATALVGFGIARSRCMANWFGQPKSWIPYYLAAVIIHALFNTLASLSELGGGDQLILLGLFLSFGLVVGIVAYVRAKIKQLDRANVGGNIRCQ